MARLLSLKDATNLVLEKLTHKQLADLLGVSPSQVYKYAVGETTSPKETVVDAFDSLSELLRAFKAQPIRNKYRAREPVWLATYGGEATGVERQYNAIKGMVLRSTDPEVKVIRDGIFSLFDSWLSKVAGKKLGRILNLEVIGLEELGDKAYRELTDEEKRKLWEKMLEFIVIPLWKSWPQYERFELAEALEKLGFTVVIEGTIG